MRPNGPELSCGGEPRRPGSQSARGNPRPIVAICFARGKSSTAGSVSLSDWLGGKNVMVHRETFFHALFLLVGLTFTLGNEVAQATLYV
jgi:hypothetical protein